MTAGPARVAAMAADAPPLETVTAPPPETVIAAPARVAAMAADAPPLETVTAPPETVTAPPEVTVIAARDQEAATAARHAAGRTTIVAHAAQRVIGHPAACSHDR